MGSGADKRKIEKLIREIRKSCTCSHDQYNVCKHTGSEQCECGRDSVYNI